MTRCEIVNSIKQLSLSQGAYGRLFDRLEKIRVNKPDVYDAYMAELESHKFKDVVDLIMYFES